MQTIIVIDDEVLVRQMLQKMLEVAGYKVVAAENGKVGLKLFTENPADLVITDIVMPEQEGIETIRLLKKVDPKVKFIAISGGGRLDPEGYLLLAKKLGARKTLMKPFKREELLASVKEVLSED